MMKRPRLAISGGWCRPRCNMSKTYVVNGVTFKWAKMTPLERFEFHKALAPGKNFQMLAPSRSRLRSPKPDPATGSPSPED